MSCLLTPDLEAFQSGREIKLISIEQCVLENTNLDCGKGSVAELAIEVLFC